MRNFLSPPRRRPPAREKYRSKFKGRGGTGNRDLHRYRRNRELLARELTTLGLWLAIGVMLVPLARSLWHVAHAHLAHRGPIVQLSLPGAALVALFFCLLRARAAWREAVDIRREQREVLARLRSGLEEDLPPNEPVDPS